MFIAFSGDVRGGNRLFSPNHRPLYFLRFIYFIFGCPGSSSLCAFLNLWWAGAILWLRHKGFSLWWLLSLQSMGCMALKLQLWHMGSFAPWHVGSSGPGIEPMFPVLAGEFLTTRPPGTPNTCFLKDKRGLCQGSLSPEQVVRLTTHLFSPG